MNELNEPDSFLGPLLVFVKMVVF